MKTCSRVFHSHPVRFLSLLLTVVLLVSALPAGTASAAELKGAFFINGNPPFAYVVTGLSAEDGDNTVKLYQNPMMQSYEGYAGIYKIPERVYNSNDMSYYTVTEISGALGDSIPGAFQGVPLQGVDLPGTISTIGPRAFAQCGALSDVTFPTSVTNLAADAFSGAFLQKLTLKVTSPATLSSELTYLPSGKPTAVVLPREVTDLLIAEPFTVSGRVSIPGEAELSASTLTISSGGTLTLENGLSGSGTVEVADGASLTLGASAGFVGSIRLTGASSEFTNRSGSAVTVLNAAGKSLSVLPGDTVSGSEPAASELPADDPSLFPQIIFNYGGDVTVKDGGKAVEIVAFEGYIVQEVVVNGLPMGDITRYEFEQASGLNSVFVTFAEGQKPEGPEKPTIFEDIPSGARYADAVNFLTDLDILHGVGGNRFAPDLKANRATVIYLLSRLGVYDIDFEVNCREPSNPFFDVDDGDWYAEAVSWAVGTNIWKSGSSVFQPYRAVTREEFALCLYRYTRARGYAAYLEAGRYRSYRDSLPLNYESRHALTWAASNGYLRCRDYTLDPAGTVTRAEMAEAFARYLKLN